MSEDSDVVWGGRPPSLVDVWWQERVRQRTVKQIVDPVSLVPLLHDVVPQMVEQLVDFLAPLDFRVAEQVIEVPKIVCPPRAARTVLRVPQTAEQLVEVPTEPAEVLAVTAVQAMGLGAAVALAEQIVDNPVPQVRRGGGGGLHGFRAGQGSTVADVEQIVEIPVPQRRRRRSGGLQSSLPGQGSTAYLEQIVDSPAREGLQGFFPGQGSSSSSRLHGGTDEGIQWVFRTFPREEKSAEEGPHLGSELGADFTPWTPAAYDAPMVAGSWSVEELEELGIWLDEFGRWWSRSGVFREGGSCTTPLMARSGGTSRAKTLPVGVLRRWQGGGRRLCGAGRRCGCCPALGQSRCLLEAEWEGRRLDAFRWGRSSSHR